MGKERRSSSCGCVFAVALIGLLLIGIILDGDPPLDREYFPPKSSQDQLDQFAMAKLDTLQAGSFAEGIEFCGMIYEDLDGNLSAPKVFRGEDATCNFEFEWGDKLNPVASFHTHGGHDTEYDNEVPSMIDIEEDINNQVDGYIATPGGRLWRVDWEKKRADLVCGEKCLKHDPDYKPCRAFPVDDSYTIESLDVRIDNDPEHC